MEIMQTSKKKVARAAGDEIPSAKVNRKARIEAYEKFEKNNIWKSIRKIRNFFCYTHIYIFKQ